MCLPLWPFAELLNRGVLLRASAREMHSAIRPSLAPDLEPSAHTHQGLIPVRNLNCS